MKRRELFQAMAATAVGVNLMGREAFDGSASPAPQKGATFTTRIRRLELRHTWTTTMSSSSYRDTLHTQFGMASRATARGRASSATSRAPWAARRLWRRCCP